MDLSIYDHFPPPPDPVEIYQLISDSGVQIDAQLFSELPSTFTIAVEEIVRREWNSNQILTHIMLVGGTHILIGHLRLLKDLSANDHNRQELLLKVEGAVIVFTGLLSVAFLNRKLCRREWSGIGIVILGLLCVGMSDVIYPSSNKTFSQNSIITGDLLIVMAQIIVATQMVVEEKFVTKHNVPALLGVGWEGLFGFVILSILLVPMYYIKVGNSIFNNPGGRMEDALDGFTQIKNNWKVALAISGTIVSIAFFNFAGLSVTKEMSATTRMVLDSIRTFVVWIVSLGLKWQDFSWLQLVGFIILLVGMCLYNDVILRPLYEKIRSVCRRSRETEPLLRSSDEESASPLARSHEKSINA